MKRTVRRLDGNQIRTQICEKLRADRAYQEVIEAQHANAA
ncbi:hypothetical protein ACVWYQ_003121 [Bradyrhizobium sp. USDA 3397]